MLRRVSDAARDCAVLHACRRCYSAEEGRDAFKTLKNQQIAYKCAHLYSEWAAMELKEGNEARAVKQLKVGIREEAQPIRWARGGALGGNGLLHPCQLQGSAPAGGVPGGGWGMLAGRVSHQQAGSLPRFWPCHWLDTSVSEQCPPSDAAPQAANNVRNKYLQPVA